MGEEVWSPAGKEALKAAFGYTDEQFDQLKANPKRREMVEQIPDMTRKKLIVECVAAENCVFNKVGDKYVFGGGGNLLKEESCEQPCLFAMHSFAFFCTMLYDRMASGLDPNDMHLDHIGCTDTGLEYGGFGKAMFRAYVVDAT